jgi:hypothetical protein
MLMAGYKKRRAKRAKKARTWQEKKRGKRAPRHAQAASRGWRLHAKPKWRPSHPKWKGSRASTAKKRKGKKGRDATYARTWSSEGDRHAKAAARGWLKTAERGWHRKPRGKKHPLYKYSRGLGSTAGTAARRRGEKVSRKAAAKLARRMHPRKHHYQPQITGPRGHHKHGPVMIPPHAHAAHARHVTAHKPSKKLGKGKSRTHEHHKHHFARRHHRRHTHRRDW